MAHPHPTPTNPTTAITLLLLLNPTSSLPSVREFPVEKREKGHILTFVWDFFSLTFALEFSGWVVV